MKTFWLIVLGLVPLTSLAAPPTIPSTVNTRPFASYDDAPLGRAFPAGVVAVQNGEAEDRPNTDPISGFEYDGSTQFRFVDWRKVARALGLED